MALRVRLDGRILCAAMYGAEKGDLYIDDATHYYLSVEKKMIVTEPWVKHRFRGEWWWHDEVPEGIEIDQFYGRN